MPNMEAHSLPEQQNYDRCIVYEHSSSDESENEPNLTIGNLDELCNTSRKCRLTSSMIIDEDSEEEKEPTTKRKAESPTSSTRNLKIPRCSQCLEREAELLQTATQSVTVSPKFCNVEVQCDLGLDSIEAHNLSKRWDKILIEHGYQELVIMVKQLQNEHIFDTPPISPETRDNHSSVEVVTDICAKLANLAEFLPSRRGSVLREDMCISRMGNSRSDGSKSSVPSTSSKERQFFAQSESCNKENYLITTGPKTLSRNKSLLGHENFSSEILSSEACRLSLPGDESSPNKPSYGDKENVCKKPPNVNGKRNSVRRSIRVRKPPKGNPGRIEVLGPASRHHPNLGKSQSNTKRRDRKNRGNTSSNRLPEMMKNMPNQKSRLNNKELTVGLVRNELPTKTEIRSLARNWMNPNKSFTEVRCSTGPRTIGFSSLQHTKKLRQLYSPSAWLNSNEFEKLKLPEVSSYNLRLSKVGIDVSRICRV